jgi:hypothetical protein
MVEVFDLNQYLLATVIAALEIMDAILSMVDLCDQRSSVNLFLAGNVFTLL